MHRKENRWKRVLQARKEITNETGISNRDVSNHQNEKVTVDNYRVALSGNEKTEQGSYRNFWKKGKIGKRKNRFEIDLESRSKGPLQKYIKNKQK